MGNSLQKSKICQICFEPITPKEEGGINPHFRCAYCTFSFCVDCTLRYVQVEVEDKNVAYVRCPGSDCPVLIHHSLLRDYLPAPVFVKWCDLLCEKALRGFQRCYCPNPRCSALIVNECGTNVRRWKCPSCQHELCSYCKMPWHSGYACDEQKEMMKDANNVLFGRLMEAKKWRRCPRCREAIELLDQGGCVKVSCRCGTRFCYRCGNLSHVCRCYVHYCRKCGSLLEECRCKLNYEPWMFLADIYLGGPYLFFLSAARS